MAAVCGDLSIPEALAESVKVLTELMLENAVDGMVHIEVQYSGEIYITKPDSAKETPK